MGVLKNLTDEYFGETERMEDKIELPKGVIRKDFTDKNGVRHHNGYFVKNGNKETLKELLKRLIEKRGLEGDFNDIDVSNINDMKELFMGCDIFGNNTDVADFNGDITGWDVSKVADMSDMFCESKKFNRPIGKWDVSGVTKMQGMFNLAEKFDQSIGDWKVNDVRDMSYMFYHAYSFNQPIGNWKVKKVMYMNYMFDTAINFNQDISGWELDNVLSFTSMFGNCPIENKYKPKKFKE